MRDSIENSLKQLEEDHTFFLSFISSLYVKENYDNELTRKKLLDTGIDYIANHILREERIMKHFKYPFLEEHRLAHKILQNTFIILIEEIALNSISHENILIILEKTMIHHIKVEDGKFFSWLNK